MIMGKTHFHLDRTTMPEFAAKLIFQIDRLVIDGTGLIGEYQVGLRWVMKRRWRRPATRAIPASRSSGPSRSNWD